jgi:hypothetical protein
MSIEGLRSEFATTAHERRTQILGKLVRQDFVAKMVYRRSKKGIFPPLNCLWPNLSVTFSNKFDKHVAGQLQIRKNFDMFEKRVISFSRLAGPKLVGRQDRCYGG